MYNIKINPWVRSSVTASNSLEGLSMREHGDNPAIQVSGWLLLPS